MDWQTKNGQDIIYNPETEKVVICGHKLFNVEIPFSDLKEFVEEIVGQN